VEVQNMPTHDTTQVAARVPIYSIVFPLSDFPAPLLTSRSFTSWAEVELAILGMTKPEVYDTGRIAFVLTWKDGEIYRAQFPLTWKTAELVTPFADHVRQALEYIAGRRPSPSMSDEQYKAALADDERFHPGRSAWAARILDGYELCGSATRGSSTRGAS
jgi:hypothetical protein